jgi:5-methylcytosine-specific restriction enzyme A
MMNLEDQLTVELRGTYEAARKRGYVATYFLQMLEEHGGQETAKRLLAKSEPQTGLFELWNLGLLNESMEAVILQEKYNSLFTETELAEAHRRLEELGYFNKNN